MMNKNLLKLQKYVWDMDAKALGKGFSLNIPNERAFSYMNNRMMVAARDSNDDDDDTDNDTRRGSDVSDPKE